MDVLLYPKKLGCIATISLETERSVFDAKKLVRACRSRLAATATIPSTRVHDSSCIARRASRAAMSSAIFASIRTKYLPRIGSFG
jgi:hypothetical protein